jgi:hypothetical protein
MMSLHPPRQATGRRRRAATTACLLAVGLAACGGGGDNPFDNPADVRNPLQVSGEKLSFVYFQKCINPILLAQLEINRNGAESLNTCAGGGCHDSNTGTGGALRVVAAAQPVDLADPSNTPDVIRESDMYKNFYSAQGSTVIGSPPQSRLLAKPLLLGVLHGGGLIFEGEQDPNAKLIAYWVTHPAPEGSDEFGPSHGMFTPADAATGKCNTE